MRPTHSMILALAVWAMLLTGAGAPAAERLRHTVAAPTALQVKLYTRTGTGHKQWVTVPGGDHAAFMETPRAYFIHALTSFLESVPD